MKIEIRNKLIYSDSKAHSDAKGIVPTGIADDIARANGFVYAELFINAHHGKSFLLDAKLKIKEKCHEDCEAQSPEH